MIRLTHDQRAQFFASHFPKVEGKGICPVGRGYVHTISSRLSFRVTAVRWPKPKEWRLDYVVVDSREDADRYLQVASHRVAVDEHGQPAPMSKNEELGYTSNPKGALDRDAPAVPSAYQNVLTMQAHQDWAEKQRTERAEENARQDARRLASHVREVAIMMARSGADPTVLIADLERLLRKYEEREAA